VAVVVAFFICWAPFHTQRLISIYSSPDDTQQHAAASKALQAVLFYSSGILYYVSSVINPILYNIMSLKFRRAFRTTLCRAGCRCCRRGRDAGDGSGGGRAGPRPRAPMAYRFNGQGHVQMLRIDNNDVRCAPGDRRRASPASAPAKISDDAWSSGAVRPTGHGSAANVDSRNTTTNAQVARRSGQMSRDPRADWRCSRLVEDRHGRMRWIHRVDSAAYTQCFVPASVADRTTV